MSSASIGVFKCTVTRNAAEALAQVLGHVQVQAYRLLEALRDVQRAFGQGVELLLGQVEAHRKRRFGQEVDREEENQGKRAAHDGDGELVHVSWPSASR